MARQPNSIAQDSNTYYFCGHKLIKRDFENKKDSEVKKASNTFTNHYSDGGKSNQSGQTLG